MFKLFLLIVFQSSLAIPSFNLLSSKAPKNENTTFSLSTETECFSYLSILRFYYDLAIIDCERPSKTFDSFVRDYYSDDNELTLLDYSYNFSTENYTYSSVLYEYYSS